MKYLKTVLLMMTLLLLTACGTSKNEVGQETILIELSDETIKVDGKNAGNDSTNMVYVANDIIYYEEGKDFTYGEGEISDAHSAEVADAHTVVHITKAGTYSISGSLSRGQIAVDLGEDAKNDENAVVTLVLNNVDITCEVAPAVIFYNVYECGNDDESSASKDVDTSAAGANVIIADGTTNNIKGSYVSRIYDPESVVLSEDGTEVKDADKLHKYDGAFYSKRSMNITGGQKNTGVLNIVAENEGLDTELHLTINGGNINISSGNDGINTNEDGISVTTINNGVLKINVTGETGEGDGIDSNGWLVINGGTVYAYACSDSADAGIDSDMGIHINGGTVIATGHMLDRIEDGGQNYAVFNFASKQEGNTEFCLKNKAEKDVMKFSPENKYSIVIYSSPELVAGTYTLWNDEKQLSGYSGSAGGMMGGSGMMGDPDMMEKPEMEGQKPEGQKPEGQRPEGQRPEGQRPENMTPPEEWEDNREPNWNHDGMNPETSTSFEIKNGENMFTVVQE